ncbi:MAG TPA: MarR family transcriptional regulator [Chthoniobacterales bacterium]
MRRSNSRREYEPLAAFRYAMRKFLRFSKELLAIEANLTPEQWEALLALKAFSTNKGLFVGELSERLQVRHHTAVSLTDKLVRQKLVTRTRGTSDRRKVHVELTRSGAALVNRLAVLHREKLRSLTPELLAALQGLQE